MNGKAGLALAILAWTVLPAAALEIEEGDKPRTNELRTILLSGSIRGREAAAGRLAETDEPAAWAALLDGMGDKKAAYIAADAVEKRIERNSAGVAELLRPGLKHSSRVTRMLSAFMLGLCKDRKSAAALADLLKDSDPSVRFHAAGALRTCGTAAVSPQLCEALKDSCPLVRLEAAAALGEIADASATEALCRALGDSDAAVNAARALGKIGGDKAETALRARLGEPRPKVLWMVIEALGECGKSPESARMLKEMEQKTGNERTRLACEKAAAKIEGRAAE